MTSLRELFDTHCGLALGKIDHFFDDYECHLSPLRLRDSLRVLEIGVHGGGSLELWQQYFGSNTQVHGIDIDPSVLANCPEGAHVHLGSQDDAEFLTGIVAEYGPFDFIVDDGSHMMSHQIKSFEVLYPSMQAEGVYICEDAFTSYWPEYGGGLRKPGTFIEYAKGCQDELNAWWYSDEENPPSEFAASTRSITVLSGAVVFQRGIRLPPRYVIRSGENMGEMDVAALHGAAKKILG